MDMVYRLSPNPGSSSCDIAFPASSVSQDSSPERLLLTTWLAGLTSR